MILSLNFEEYKTEIITADAHYSHKDDVVVVVTGCLFEKESKDNVGRKFSQSFLLAPQENGHFVLTDLFRYLDKGQVLKAEPELDNSTSESSATAPEHEPSHIPKVAVPDTTAPIVEKPTNVNNEDKEEEILEEPPQ
ncbi:hypothetical protein MKW94_008833, partial [Papaver nudicaule]|nr:hypothetical protein [Papaver nudicaule]